MAPPRPQEHGSCRAPRPTTHREREQTPEPVRLRSRREPARGNGFEPAIRRQPARATPARSAARSTTPATGRPALTNCTPKTVRNALHRHGIPPPMPPATQRSTSTTSSTSTAPGCRCPRSPPASTQAPPGSESGLPSAAVSPPPRCSPSGVPQRMARWNRTVVLARCTRARSASSAPGSLIASSGDVECPRGRRPTCPRSTHRSTGSVLEPPRV
jgi:hypothetical protein